MQIRFGKKEAMDILIRHTLNSVLRNPVQSLIVVASTAMITACILVCLCISSLFEQLAGLKAGTWYAGADLYISALTTHAKEVADYAAALTAVADAWRRYFAALTSNPQAVTAGVAETELDMAESVRGSMRRPPSSMQTRPLHTAYRKILRARMPKTFDSNRRMSYNLQAITRAWVAKLADAQDSGSCEQYAHVGSSPVPRTKCSAMTIMS